MTGLDRVALTSAHTISANDLGGDSSFGAVDKGIVRERAKWDGQVLSDVIGSLSHGNTEARDDRGRMDLLHQTISSLRHVNTVR